MAWIGVFGGAAVVAVAACKAGDGTGGAMSTGTTTAATTIGSTTSKSSTSAGGSCGPDYFQGDACHACGENSCCTEKQACAADADCAQMATCASACAPTDHACIQTCVAAANNPTTTAGLELRACLVSKCAAPCNVAAETCGGSAAKVPACDTCEQTSCCAELAARNTSAEALTYFSCVDVCAATAAGKDYAPCIHACRVASPNGAVLVDASQFCTIEKCPVCGDGQCAGPSTFKAGACEACESANCCGQATACNQDGRCFAEGKSCITSCNFGDVACDRACADANPAVIGNLGALLTCSLDKCASSCFPVVAPQITCAGIGYFDPPSCGTCEQTSCCNEGLACHEDAECSALAYCVSSCTDATCEATCESMHPSASALWMPYHACRTTTCAASCGGF